MMCRHGWLVLILVNVSLITWIGGTIALIIVVPTGAAGDAVIGAVMWWLAIAGIADTFKWYGRCHARA